MKYLIICDPSGVTSLTLMNRGVSKNDIWVYDDTHKGLAVSKIRGVHTVHNIDSLIEQQMKFDVIIGNPPYTDTSSVVGAVEGGCSGGLDNVFFMKSINLAPRVSLIIRAKHFAKNSSKFRRELFSTGHVKEIRALSADTFPSISLTETCVVTYDESYTGPCKVTYQDQTVKYIDLKGDTCLRLTNPNYQINIPNSLAPLYQRGDLNLNVLTDGDCPMIITMGAKGKEMIVQNVSSSQHQCCVNQHGVVMNSKYGGAGLGKVYVKPYDHSVSGSAIILKTDTMEDAEKLKSYLESDEIHDLVVKNKISNANTQELFSTIPNPL